MDARKIGDLLRCDYFLECHMASREIRDRRRVLRYRNLLVRQAVQMKDNFGVGPQPGIRFNWGELHFSNWTCVANPATPSNSSENWCGTDRKEVIGMPGTYKTIELVGTSQVSFTEAVKAAVADASATVRHMDWFEVVQERGRIVNGQVHEFQVVLKVGFMIELGDRSPVTRLGTADESSSAEGTNVVPRW